MTADRDALIDAASHLAAAASAYRKYAKRHASLGKVEADPFFTTRVKDFDDAAERVMVAARAALAASEPQPAPSAEAPAKWACPDCHMEPEGCEVGRCTIGCRPPAPAQPAAALVELSDHHIDAIGLRLLGKNYGGNTDRDFARAVIAAHIAAQPAASQSGDAALLDWLDATCCSAVAEGQSIGDPHGEHVANTWSVTWPAANVREAIRQCIAARPSGGEDDARIAAVRDVLAERHRQVEVEGWTPEHDDEHPRGELAQAAACYAAMSTATREDIRALVPSSWPWEKDHWKPAATRRMLIKAGALILAEIERLDRAARQSSASGESGNAK